MKLKLLLLCILSKDSLRIPMYLVLMCSKLLITENNTFKDKPGFDYAIRTEFKKNAVGLEKTDVLRIEHLMRNGKRKLEMIQDSNVSGMGHFVKEKDNE